MSPPEVGAAGALAPEPAEAEEGLDAVAEELADELALALAPEHPGVPSPMSLPRSASRHCWESASPQMPSPGPLALS
jgi:hypothetical protein